MIRIFLKHLFPRSQIPNPPFTMARGSSVSRYHRVRVSPSHAAAAFIYSFLWWTGGSMVDAVRVKQLIRAPVLKCWTRVVIHLALHASPVIGALHQSLYTIGNHRLTRPFMSLETPWPRTSPTRAFYLITWPYNER